MTKCHFVKKCRKAIRGSGIKKGDSYYWWKFPYGKKLVSKDRPKQSQLTQSEFYLKLFSIQENLEEYPVGEGLKDLCETIADDLDEMVSDLEEKLSNMPESLQEGPTGELLRDRIDNCSQAAGEFRDIDFSGEPDEGLDEDEDEIAENSNFYEITLEDMKNINLSFD